MWTLLWSLSCKEDAPAPAPEAAPVAAPARLRRLTDAQYRRAAERLLGVRYEGELPGDYMLYGYTNVGSGDLSISPLELEQYEAAAWWLAEAAVPDDAARDLRMGCAAGAPLGMPAPSAEAVDRCFRGWALRLAGEAWRRPAEGDEVESLVGLAAEATALGGATAGAQAVVAAALLSPSFLFQVEQGVDQGEGTEELAPGYRRLTGEELASRLAFFLTDDAPDRTLRAAAASGELLTEAGLTAQVDRLLGSAAAGAAMARFFRESIELDRLWLADKDEALYPLSDTLRADMAAEVEELFTRIWSTDADYRDLLLDDQAWVTPELGALYGVEVGAPGLIHLGPDRRGLLGRAAFLTLTSHSTLTSPTRRGRYVRMRLLCQDVPPPPPGVAVLPEVAEGTLRDRMEVHATDPMCAGCHTLMDPPGFALEHFDPIGGWRDLDNGLPVDASGELDGVAFDGAGGLAQAVADSHRFGPCVARQMYRHATGHLETDAEEPVIEALGEGFVQDGLRLRGLARALALHPSFGLVRAPQQGSCTEEEEGDRRACSTGCGGGEEVCEGGQWSGCDAPAPAPEVCDGADNDCDGYADEYVVEGCVAGSLYGLRTCAGGAFGACEMPDAPSEACNGEDDDQDGAVDEDLSAFLHTASDALLSATLPGCDPAGDPDAPACRAATHRICAATGCAAGGLGRVAGDAWTDSGALLCAGGSAEAVSTTFTELSAYHGGCTASTRQGPDCNAAINRLCAARGQGTGFGPVENNGDVAVVVCVPEAWKADTYYSTLITLDGRCDGNLSRDGAGCNEAIHMYCQSLGALSGFGPLENSADYAQIACVGALP